MELHCSNNLTLAQPIVWEAWLLGWSHWKRILEDDGKVTPEFRQTGKYKWVNYTNATAKVSTQNLRVINTSVEDTGLYRCLDEGGLKDADWAEAKLVIFRKNLTCIVHMVKNRILTVDTSACATNNLYFSLMSAKSHVLQQHDIQKDLVKVNISIGEIDGALKMLVEDQLVEAKSFHDGSAHFTLLPELFGARRVEIFVMMSQTMEKVVEWISESNLAAFPKYLLAESVQIVLGLLF